MTSVEIEHSTKTVTITDEDKTTLEHFLAKHQDRCIEWMKRHREHEKFPVIKTEDGYRWLSREDRRKLK